MRAEQEDLLGFAPLHTVLSPAFGAREEASTKNSFSGVKHSSAQLSPRLPCLEKAEDNEVYTKLQDHAVSVGGIRGHL